jgi:hypothetical protein
VSGYLGLTSELPVSAHGKVKLLKLYIFPFGLTIDRTKGFNECVVVPGYFQGICVNCRYYNRQSLCSPIRSQ